MVKYKNYSDEDIIAGAATVKSIAGLLRHLGLRTAGGNYYTMKVRLHRLNVDTSHWTGQAWNKGQQLKSWDKYSKTSRLKHHLVRARGHACEECGIEEWQNLPLVLELDHIDGDRINNDTENLKLLCPNCHSQTPTWRNRKR